MYQIFSLRNPHGRIVYAGRKKLDKIKSEDIVPISVLMKHEIDHCCKLSVHKEAIISDTNAATMYVRQLMQGYAPVDQSKLLSQSVRIAIIDEFTQDRRNYFADFILNPKTGTFDVVEAAAP